MKLRCELHLDGRVGRLILVPRREETLDHLALKLAAYAMFNAREPSVEPSSNHPALIGTDFRPDVMALDEAGTVNLWIECGAVTINKVDKVTRRFPYARVVVIKATEREALRLRADVDENVRHARRIEIWAFKDGDFAAWRQALGEKTEIFGDAAEKTFNLVVNETAFAAELVSLSCGSSETGG